MEEQFPGLRTLNTETLVIFLGWKQQQLRHFECNNNSPFSLYSVSLSDILIHFTCERKNEGRPFSPDFSVVRLAVPGQDGPDVRDEPEGVQHRQEIQEGRVGGVVEPGLDWNRVVWVGSVGSRGVVEDED